MITIVEKSRNVLRNPMYFRLIIITLVYFFTHGYMLILSGTWWDEYTWLFDDEKMMFNTAMQLGRPSVFFVMKFIMSIPEGCARICIFLLYYATALCFHFIYLHIFHEENGALISTLVYIVIPANDARVMRGVFEYGAGFLCFMLAFCILIVLQEKYEYHNFAVRILILILFLCSFTLNSCLCFYALPLIYILCYAIKNRLLKKLFKFMDFLLLPFIYFFGKISFFPAFGLYDGYNSVDKESVMKGILISANTFIITLERILIYWTKYIWIGLTSSIMIMSIICMASKKIGKSHVDESNDKKSAVVKQFCVQLGSGLSAVFLAIYPYGVAGQSYSLVGVDGRSSILLGVGGALFFGALIFVIRSKWIREAILILIVVCGACHFCYFYLTYQQDYYRQLDLKAEIQEHKTELIDRKNIFYITDSEPIIYATRFYSLNGVAGEVFGDLSHCFFTSLGECYWLKEDNQKTLKSFTNDGDYRMRDYEPGRSRDIEAIIYYHSSIDKWTTLKLKREELFNKLEFERDINSFDNVEIAIVGTKEFEAYRESLNLP